MDYNKNKDDIVLSRIPCGETLLGDHLWMQFPSEFYQECALCGYDEDYYDKE